MNRPTFDEIFMHFAQNIAKMSHCVKMKVGAVLIKDTRIISIGYNGPPAKTYNCDETWPDVGCPRDEKGGCSMALHAEHNAIIYALKNNVSVNETTLYVTLSPCLQCAKIILSVGIKEIVYLESYAKYKGQSCEEGLNFLKRFGISLRIF